MHILLIHQAFASPNEPGGTRHYELARYSVHSGHSFTIIASNLSYLTGKPVSKWSGLMSEERLDGVRILRTYTIASLHHSFAWRVVSFSSFMVLSAWAALAAGPADLVMGTSPPIFQAVSAWLVSAIRRRPFLLEIRDLWPEFAIDMGVLRNSVLIWVSRALERFLYGRADHILINSPAYHDYLISRNVSPDKISLISNGVASEMFDPASAGMGARREWGLENKFVVTYSGALGMANDIPTILKAAQSLQDVAAVHFLMVGDGKERRDLESEAHQLGLSNVTFTGTRPKSEMPEILAASDACVATLQDIPMFRMTYPNKVFDYMAAGRPTILAIDGVIRRVVEEAGAGLCVGPGDHAALAGAVRQLYANRAEGKRMGTAARAYVAEHFDRRQQSERFVELLEQMARSRPGLYALYVKRALDLVLTASGLLLLGPISLVVAILILIKLGRPVFFAQRRVGWRGVPFNLVKFRTMSSARDLQGNLLPDADRLTAFGSFLRSTSLDELPEFVNVLRGDMSLVGPRPLLIQYLQRYTPEQRRRHEVKPGITGWAQVNGRNDISWEDKFALDIWYVDHQSLLLDLRIIALTVWKILKREGINQPGHATAQEFMGEHS